MTIKELYEWAVKNGVEDFSIVCAYADEAGFHPGNRDAFEPAPHDIDYELKEVEI